MPENPTGTPPYLFVGEGLAPPVSSVSDSGEKSMISTWIAGPYGSICAGIGVSGQNAPRLPYGRYSNSPVYHPETPSFLIQQPRSVTRTTLSTSPGATAGR